MGQRRGGIEYRANKSAKEEPCLGLIYIMVRVGKTLEPEIAEENGETMTRNDNPW